MYLSIPLYIRRKVGEIEKKLLRDSFKGVIPESVLYRKKEAFSDGVSSTDNSWFNIIQTRVKQINLPECYHQFNPPQTEEQKYYRYLFEQDYEHQCQVIPYFWMPNWSNTTDPSARTI